MGDDELSSALGAATIGSAATDGTSHPPSPRLFLVSDLHVNCEDNFRWLEQLSSTAFLEDGLIVAGDVSEELEQLEAALRLLRSKFSRVWFTCGNHDLWLTPNDARSGCRTSMTKCEEIMDICEALGVETGPGRFGEAEEGRGVWVWPLLSFHHQSFDTEPEVQGWEVPAAADVMLDYRECVWPKPLSMLDDSVAIAVDQLNDSALGSMPAAEREAFERRDPAREPLVTFSHFLPRQELLPEKRFLFVPELPKASGSAYLGKRVAALKPSIHCFGHTHFAWDMVCDDGVRYIQAALSNPTERMSRWHTLQIGDFGRAGPLLLWSSQGGIVPRMHGRWSAFYEHHERLRQLDGRTEFQMARYAARFPRTDKRAEVVDPDFSHESGSGAAAGVRMRTTDPVLADPRAAGSEGGGALQDRAWPRGVWRSGANPL
jgi:hypothetical protein